MASGSPPAGAGLFARERTAVHRRPRLPPCCYLAGFFRRLTLSVSVTVRLGLVFAWDLFTYFPVTALRTCLTVLATPSLP
jgi:hypothetical protein